MPPTLIRAVVTDVDGTIIGPDRTVSAATAAAVRGLRQTGIPLVIATARTPAGIAVLGPALADVTIAVCSNGAIGAAPGRGDVLWRQRLAPDVLHDVAAVLAGRLPDARFGAYDGHSWTVVPGYLGLRSWRPVGPVQIASPARVCAGPACAVGICHPVLTAGQIAAVIHATGAVRGRATMSYGSDDTLDMAPAGVDKGSGVRRALAALGVDPADAIGFGDAMNDLAMFAAVGHRVAVANAAAEVLAAADEVTGAVTDDGVAAWLRVALPRVSATLATP